MNKNIIKVTNGLVMAGIFLTLLALISLPLVMTAFFKSALSMTDTNLDMVVVIAIYICAIPYLIALFSLKKMCKLLLLNQPFSSDMPKQLKIISKCSFSELLLFNLTTLGLFIVYDIYLYAFTIVSCLVISFVSLVICLLSLVFANLFKTAIEIKNENDYTV
ncbi:DUF2975 domain-containing protein [Rummeliibacillus pycnus]|uniref:DUF2975 domain-containing protein n=1 Tax=Rummeliibacillus pycnus TaxID=101070 RepID=UPI0037C5314A